MWTLAVVLIAIWLTASAVVWIVEAIVAWRRKTPLPRVHVPRAMSDPKFGRTAAAAAAILAVLALIGSIGEEFKTPASVRADSSMSATEDGSTQAVSTTAGTVSSTTKRRAAHARAQRRAAEARVKRRAAKRAATARAARRQREARRRAAAAATAAQRDITNASGGRCDPNYEGACLDPDASDYDCEGGSGDGPEYTGTVRVVGDDPYDLDRDGDGTGCDP
jgi:hypothetical protein